jgi:uncharacterized protein involved in cysteine biosynthesis
MIRGFTALFRALPMVFEDARLLRLAMLPALITLFASVASGLAMIFWGRHYLEHFHLGALVSVVLLIIVGAAATWIAYLLIGLVAVAPFADAISERADTLLGAPAPPKRPFHYVFVGLSHTLLLIALYLAIAIPLFLIHFVLPAVAPVTAVIGFLVTAFFFAWDAFDPALSRRGMSFAEKYAFFREHRGEALGLGVAALLASAIPFAGLIVPPLAVAAAARLHHEHA